MMRWWIGKTVEATGVNEPSALQKGMAISLWPLVHWAKWLLFAVCLSFWFKLMLVDKLDSPGDDFSSIVAASQVMKDGNPANLYDHDPVHFDALPSGAYQLAAEEIGFRGILHP